MLYRILADLVVALHAAFILFVAFGALLLLRWHRLVWVHLPAIIWAALLSFFGWICPLTPLENTLRRASGRAGYTGGFIEHYLTPLIYPAGLTSRMQVVLGLGVVLINVGLYVYVFRRRRRSK